MAKKKRVNPHRIPLPKNAINKDKILEEAMKDDMVHAWLLVAGPLLEAGYELATLADAVNTYMKFYGDKNKNKELDRAQAAIGLPLLQLDPCRIKSPIELEKFKRKVKKIALDTALCVVYLGLEKKIEAEELKRIFFNADLTRAEVEHGLTSFEELEREMLTRTAELGGELGRISND